MSAPVGVLVVDKPAGLTSSTVVQRVRRALARVKAGHTGTLDPIATGVLPVCLGEATKIAGLLQGEDKAYEGTALLGVETDTLDVTGKVTAERELPASLTEAILREIMESLGGAQQQVPPAYSAVHRQGVRAYVLARRGEEVELPPREVHIRRLALTLWAPPRLSFSVECSKGTYVRSLCAELGRRLGCGATLAALRRTRTGCFDLSRSVRIDGEPELAALEASASRGELPIYSIDEALAELPAVELDADAEVRIRQGQAVTCSEPPAATVRIRCGETLVALGEVRGGQVWPRRVFAAH
jgi:tRNA pseudouridine55 synthase